jgi:hypothetical protein
MLSTVKSVTHVSCTKRNTISSFSSYAICSNNVSKCSFVCFYSTVRKCWLAEFLRKAVSIRMRNRLFHPLPNEILTNHFMRHEPGKHCIALN